MIHRLSKALTNFLANKKILPCEEIEVYEYGFELLISSVIGFLIVLVSGLIFNNLLKSMLFYFIFVTVRPFCGGYHADTHFKCKLTFIIVYAAVMIFSSIFAANYDIIYQLLVLAVYILTIILYAPVEHPNKPLDLDERKRNRNISVVLAVVLSAGSFVIAYFSIEYATIITLTLLSVSILMMITKLNKEETGNEKDIS